MSEADKKKADEEYKKALAEREEAEKYNASIGVINLKLKEGNDAMAKNDFAAAITAFKEAVTANPTIHISQGNLAIALQKRAVKQFNEGNRDAAKEIGLAKAAHGRGGARKWALIEEKSELYLHQAGRVRILGVSSARRLVLAGDADDAGVVGQEHLHPIGVAGADVEPGHPRQRAQPAPQGLEAVGLEAGEGQDGAGCHDDLSEPDRHDERLWRVRRGI